MESLKCDMGKISHTSDELIMGSYPEDTWASTGASNKSADKGNIATATEYNSDATKTVDHSTDTGFEGGKGGGESPSHGMLEEAAKSIKGHMLKPSCEESGSQLTSKIH